MVNWQQSDFSASYAVRVAGVPGQAYRQLITELMYATMARRCRDTSLSNAAKQNVRDNPPLTISMGSTQGSDSSPSDLEVYSQPLPVLAMLLFST